jgi:hypothetical protein
MVALNVVRRVLPALAAVVLAAGCGGETPTPSPGSAATDTPAPRPSVVAVASPTATSHASPTPTTTVAPAATSTVAPTNRPPESWAGAGRLRSPAQDPVGVQLPDGTVLLAERTSIEYDSSETAPGDMGAVEWTMPAPRVQRYSPEVGHFEVAARLDTARDGFAMAALPDGRVLVVGGLNEDLVGKSSTRIWNPARNRWAPGPLMSVARYLPAMGVLPDGSVLVAGGRGAKPAGAYQASAERFDPVRSAWLPAADLPTGNEIWAFASLSDGSLLVVQHPPNGSDDFAPAPAYRYDPGSGEWEDIGAPPIGDTLGIELAGLRDGGALLVTEDGAVIRYAPGAGWTQAGRTLVRRSSPAVVQIDDGRVLIAGGARRGNDLASVELFDPATGTSIDGRAMPVARRNGLAMLLGDGSVLLAGGWADSKEIMRVVRWVP